MTYTIIYLAVGAAFAYLSIADIMKNIDNLEHEMAVKALGHEPLISFVLFGVLMVMWLPMVLYTIATMNADDEAY